MIYFNKKSILLSAAVLAGLATMTTAIPNNRDLADIQTTATSFAACQDAVIELFQNALTAAADCFSSQQLKGLPDMSTCTAMLEAAKEITYAACHIAAP